MEKQWEDYQNLFRLSKKARVLEGISHLLGWDQETYMPLGSAGIRGEQQKLITGMIHEIKTSPAFRKALENCIDPDTGKILVKDLPEPQHAALRRWHHDFKKDTALPQEFVEDFSQLTSQAQIAWRDARREDDFGAFAPFLEKIVEMSRQRAEYLGYEKHPYNALLDLFEPELTIDHVEPLFDRLEKGLRPWIERAQGNSIDDSFLHGEFAPMKQEKIGMDMLEKMGFLWDIGRLDLSAHPFSSSSHPTDNRITSRIHPTSIMSYLGAVLHEGGHALYEKNLPPGEYGSPLGDAISLGIHESQSRWWETRVGLTKPFWQHYFPMMQEEFPILLRPFSLASFYRAINRVVPSLIRIEADEVTYPMHVILRFRLEKQLIEGSLKVSDVPEAWNEGIFNLLGVRPEDDREGCLQDIHWSMGGFGYFPTYTLGTLYASCFFEAFEKKHPDWEHEVAQGRLLFIEQWLKENIHRYGRQYSSLELLEKVCGKPFSEKPFLDYINKKYTEIYS